MAHNGPPRSRSPKGNNGDDNKQESADTSELETKMLDMWTKKIKPLADEMHETNQKAIQDMVIKTVSSEIGQLKSQVVGLESFVKSEIGDVKSEIGGVKTAVERIEQALAASSALPPPAAPPLPSGGSQVHQGTSRPQSFADAVRMGTPNLGSQQPVVRDVTTPNFNRKLDPTKLFCNLHERAKVSKSLFQKAISVLANEAAISDTQFCISGDALDNRFEIKFAGDERTASVCALQFYESLYLGRGQRKEQVVEDDQGKKVKFYIAPDKNPCQIRREILGKNLCAILAPKKIDAVFSLKKATGSVYEGTGNNKRIVCSVVITGPESARLDWCHPKRIDLGIEQAPVEQEFSGFVIGGGSNS
jgi:hypothetical protein